MPRYIEFTTKSKHTDFTNGEPVHNGQVPPRYLPVKGVTIDGMRVTFSRPDTLDRLHRTLHEGNQIGKTNPFDCVVFALLMAGVDISEYTGRGEMTFCATRHNDNNDAISLDGDILDLGAYRGSGDVPAFVHTISTAPLDVAPNYLHKLGSEGPVCLSSLEAAQKMYRAPIVKKLVEFTLEAPGQSKKSITLGS